MARLKGNDATGFDDKLFYSQRIKEISFSKWKDPFHSEHICDKWIIDIASQTENISKNQQTVVLNGNFALWIQWCNKVGAEDWYNFINDLGSE